MFLKISKISFFLLVLLYGLAGYSQLSDFTLTVTPTDEQCLGQGALDFEVSGATPGSTILFAIYELPGLELVATTALYSYTGLSAGSYQVTATQSLGGFSNSQTQTTSIASQIVDLTYQLSSQAEICGNDGVLTVTPLTGTPVSYEIISGPVIAPLQTSAVFNELTAGVYVVRVFDACGEGVVQTYTLLEGNPGINLGVEPVAVSDCDSMEVSLTISPAPNAAAAYPMTITCTVYPPEGDPVVFTQTIESPGDGEVFHYTETVPNYEGETFTYVISVTDNCGNVYESTNIISSSQSEPGYSILSGECAGTGLMIFNITGLILDSAPAAYGGEVPFDFTSQIGDDNIMVFGELPPGQYDFTVTGLCGEVSELSVNILPPTSSAPGVTSFSGCEPGFGSVVVSGNFQSVIMTGAPAGFGQTLPFDVSFNITSNGSMVMNQLPMGTYSFHVVDNCGSEFDVATTIQGYTQQTQVSLTPHCGSFDLYLTHTSTGSLSQQFWLQKLNPATGQWGHPGTGFPYNENTQANATNSLALSPNTMNYNLAYTGEFRILKIFQSLGNGSLSFVDCYEVVYNFDYDDGPSIDSVFSFSCTTNTFDVVVQAEGVAPLIYRITAFNGNPTAIDNGTSNVFSALEAGIYNFQVEDPCGNIVNRVFEIETSVGFSIAVPAFCEGQSATVTVPYFDFFDYQWWMGTDIANILSTTGQLTFSSFDPAIHNGVYHVRIKNPDPLSCIDIVLDFNVNGIPAPNAGTGLQSAFCDRPTVDLFTLLQPPFDMGGTWSEVESSGALNAGLADLSNQPEGTYHFVYSVQNSCGEDFSTVTILLNSAPVQPVATVLAGNCQGDTIELFASGTPETTFLWTGPNGFSSQDQNPVIENAGIEYSGTFTVVSTIGQCVSQPASVNVVIGVEPLFTVSASCENDIRQLTVSPVGDSFSVQDVSYSWSGPAGFSSSTNPAVITGNAPGEYSVTVTSTTGCPASQSIAVSNTLCVMPLGISPNSDGMNDEFDLSGFDVENLQIFNRYGVTVYEAANYRDQWVGQDFKGRILPAGAYYFLVRLNSGEIESGWVYLNREH